MPSRELFSRHLQCLDITYPFESYDRVSYRQFPMKLCLQNKIDSSFGTQIMIITRILRSFQYRVKVSVSQKYMCTSMS